MSTTPTPTNDPSSLTTSQNTGAHAFPGPESLSPVEQDILDEYARLVTNLNNLSTLLSTLSATPSSEILDALRRLERKTSLVFTLLKSSVYSIVMNQTAFEGGDGEDGMGEGGGFGDGGVTMTIRGLR